MRSPEPKRHFLERVERTLGLAEAAIVTLAMAAILIGILLGVGTRLLALRAPNLGEIAIVAMSPLTFVGAALCSYLRRHITLDIAEFLPSAALRRAVRFAAAAAMAVFAGYVTYIAWDFFLFVLSSGERLIDLGTPVAVPVGFFVLGAVLMLVHAVFDMLRELLGLPAPAGFA
jgi:TRAP-type C4-dicarboxylate transport system permease small subunit